MLTGEQVEMLEALLAKATPGEWAQYGPDVTDAEGAPLFGLLGAKEADDTALVVAMKAALPALLQLARVELNRQRARANEPEWCPRCFRDVLNFWRDDDGIPRCTDCGAKIVALVPVPVKEG